VLETVIEVIVDQGLLGYSDRFLDCMQLLSQVHAVTPLFDHPDDSSQVTFGALQAFAISECV